MDALSLEVFYRVDCKGTTQVVGSNQLTLC
jgi:hypothetical protein